MMPKARVNPETSEASRLLAIEKGFTLATHVITWAGIVSVVYLISSAVSDLAGRTTLADIALQVLLAGNVREVGSYAIAGGGITYGLWERRLRKSEIRHLGEQKKLLESVLDPNRSSSQLTETGETRPEDR